MDIGIFQNKERKLPSGRRLYNDACPYLRDVMIRCTYDKSGSKFDSKHCTKLADGLDMFHNREMPSKLLEFATPVNMGILGEPALPVTHWSKYFSISLTEKPYIEVQFVQVPESTLKPSYSLMALRHQHEISDVFNFNFLVPGAEVTPLMNITSLAPEIARYRTTYAKKSCDSLRFSKILHNGPRTGFRTGFFARGCRKLGTNQ